MKIKSIIATATFCLAAAACTEKVTPENPSEQNDKPVVTEYTGTYVVTKPSGVAMSKPKEEKVTVSDVNGTATISFPAFFFSEESQTEAFEISNVSLKEKGGSIIVSHDGGVEMKDVKGKKVTFDGIEGEIKDGKLSFIYDITFHKTSNDILTVHAYFNVEPVVGYPYAGEMTCGEAVKDISVYIDYNVDMTEATISVPEFTMPAMGKEMTLPSIRFSHVAVTENEETFALEFSITEPYIYSYQGTNYEITGFQGSDTENEAFTETRAVLDYKVKPGRMPFPLEFHFDGVYMYPKVD